MDSGERIYGIVSSRPTMTGNNLMASVITSSGQMEIVLENLVLGPVEVIVTP
jgi:hypothetical protein